MSEPVLPSRAAMKKPASGQQNARPDIGEQTFRRTLMPALCAERRAPPTAIRRQPGRMREQHDMPENGDDEGGEEGERERQTKPLRR